MRAMSPAINDPFTAMTCLDHLGAGLSICAERSEPQPFVCDTSNRLRLIFQPVTFADLLEAALNMLRRASRENTNVLLHMVDTLEKIARKSKQPEQRAEILRHVRLIEAESQASASVAWDKECVTRRCAEALKLIGQEQ